MTEEDFDQVLSGNFVTKVIYLPDAEFQELALAGVETLVSTRLDPGVDPIVEADRRGSILAIIRIGNKDLQIPGGLISRWRRNAVRRGPDGSAGGGLCGPLAWVPVRAARTPPELFGHDGAAVRYADVGHADRTAWSAAHSVRRAGRLAEARHEESHLHGSCRARWRR